MTESQLPQFLADAVPPIPDEHAIAPLGSIRRRARRRRVVATAGAAAFAVVAVVGLTVAISALPRHDAQPAVTVTPSGSATPSIAPTPSSSPTPSQSSTALPGPADSGYGPPGSMRIARVDTAGTGLTIWVNPDIPQCLHYTGATLLVDERADRVVVTHSGVATAAPDCGNVGAAARTVTLSQPLSGRRLVDGEGTRIPVAYDADLPQPPASWTPMAMSYGQWDETGFPVQHYVRYVAPAWHEIVVHVYSTTVARTFVAEMALGSRTGSVFLGVGTAGSGTQLPGVQWRVADRTYEMYVSAGIDPMSVEAIEGIVAEFTWP